MTEREICISYKGARRPDEQTQIMAELNCTDRLEIIKILVKNDVKLARSTVGYLQRRLDRLDKLIVKKEKKRREAAKDGHLKMQDRMNREIEDGECEYRKIAEILNTAKAWEAEEWRALR